MRHLPRKKILPREKSGSNPDQEIPTAHKAARRRARICSSSGQDSARTILQTLARHVDLAATASQTGKSAANLHIDLSVHASSRCVESLRATPSKDRELLAALDQNRFTRLDPDAFAPPKSGAAPSQRSNSNTITPAAVVRIVIGIPKRA